MMPLLSSELLRPQTFSPAECIDVSMSDGRRRSREPHLRFPRGEGRGTEGLTSTSTSRNSDL
jgi:hypothetical protein